MATRKVDGGSPGITETWHKLTEGLPAIREVDGS